MWLSYISSKCILCVLELSLPPPMLMQSSLIESSLILSTSESRSVSARSLVN